MWALRPHWVAVNYKSDLALAHAIALTTLSHARQQDHLEASGIIDSRTRDVSDDKRREKRPWTTDNEPQ
jgi:hypothetical protein